MSTQVLTRTTQLLRQLAISRSEGLRLVDLCQLTSLERGTVHRLLKDLIIEGLVSQDHQSNVTRLVAEALAAARPIDILVNCAGGSRPTSINASDEDWDEAFDLNFTAARRLTQAVLPAMSARQWGRIVSISGSMEPRAMNAAMVASAK
jgi:3-oxoacyl-[acyl-carrier protein] reductase